MTYNLISIASGLNKPYVEYNHKEVDDYFSWFLSIKNQRLKILYDAVFGSEDMTFSSEKLQAIQYFLEDNIVTKPRPLKEIEKIRQSLPKELQNIHKIPAHVFVEPTLSIMIDVGIYLAEYMRTEIPGLEWDMERESDMVYFGRPVLMKQGLAQRFCPSWLIEVVVDKVYDKRAKEDELLELFKIWKNNLEGKKMDLSAKVAGWAKKVESKGRRQ